MDNIFELTLNELKEIANLLHDRIEDGIEKDGMEIACIPTHSIPEKEIKDGKVLALDWGGTNFRAAIVEFKNGKGVILEISKIRLSAEETKGFNANQLFEKMAECIGQLECLDETVTQIGFCFSYPTILQKNGDAILSHWAKGMDVSGMVGQPINKLLMDYLNGTENKNKKTTIKKVTVLNDTIACLFAGLNNAGYDSYIGLIVGTGTNMAGLMPLNKIKKLNDKEGTDSIPVNLEAGNFSLRPRYLTAYDDEVDKNSDNKGKHRFEKAVSGKYVSELFKMSFEDFDAYSMSKIVANPQKSIEKQVEAVRQIYDRSAKLVTASLTGLVQVLVAQDPSIGKICLLADGSVFWDKNVGYKDTVSKTLKLLLPAGVRVDIAEEMTDPNMIGSAIAALS
jgi:hexokinase